MEESILGTTENAKIKAMTNMAKGAREKQLLLILTIPFVNYQWTSVIKNRVFLK